MIISWWLSKFLASSTVTLCSISIWWWLITIKWQEKQKKAKQHRKVSVNEIHIVACLLVKLRSMAGVHQYGFGSYSGSTLRIWRRYASGSMIPEGKADKPLALLAAEGCVTSSGHLRLTVNTICRLLTDSKHSWTIHPVVLDSIFSPPCCSESSVTILAYSQYGHKIAGLVNVEDITRSIGGWPQILLVAFQRGVVHFTFQVNSHLFLWLLWRLDYRGDVVIWGGGLSEIQRITLRW